MQELVLDLIVSYENRIATVEELFTTAYQAVAGSDLSFAELDEENERLRTSLQEALARNCSLRRKDFNHLMEKAFSDANRKRREIEEEQEQVREKLKDYLNKQKELTFSLRGQLVKFMQDKADKDSLKTLIDDFKATYEDKGGRVFTLLRNFQWHLEALRKEREEINHRLESLLVRGESLRIEDLRQLESAKAHQDRKTSRELRRQEVERLLLHFKQQRQGGQPP